MAAGLLHVPYRVERASEDILIFPRDVRDVIWLRSLVEEPALF
jgi:hypothetical protein